ncbi:hypothetical protein ACVWXO_008627 [Bradyrhizobium sp. LM2.7]
MDFKREKSSGLHAGSEHAQVIREPVEVVLGLRAHLMKETAVRKAERPI